MRAQNRLQATGTVACRQGGGRLREESVKERIDTLSPARGEMLLYQQQLLATANRVSCQTVRDSRVRCRVPLLTAEQRRKMQWALSHRHGRVEDWSHCVMTDERRVCHYKKKFGIHLLMGTVSPSTSDKSCKWFLHCPWNLQNSLVRPISSPQPHGTCMGSPEEVH